MPAALTPRTSRPAQVVDLGSLNLDEIATALADQTDYVPMVDQPAGRRDGLLDLDELDLVCIDPLPPMSGTRTWPTSPNGSATGAPAPTGAGHRRQGSVPPVQGRADLRLVRRLSAARHDTDAPGSSR